jgi:hypothetical protein
MGLSRQLFGPSRDDIWSELSQEIGADFQKGGAFGTSKLIVTHHQWEITLDTYQVTTGKTHTHYSRARAPFLNPDGFRFGISPKTILSGLGKSLGMQDIEVGDPAFDDAFIIKGTDVDKVQRLLMNARLRQLIQSLSMNHLEVKDNDGLISKRFPPDADEIYWDTHGVMLDKQRIKDLFTLFALMLDELCRLGFTQDCAPGVSFR